MIEKTEYANNFHWNSWWGNFSYWKVFRGFLGTCCPILKKRGNQLKYFQGPQSTYRNYVSLVFSTSTRRRNLVQMSIISGDSWKRLSIIANSYLSCMWREHMPITSVTSLAKPGIITLSVDVLKKTCFENMQQIYRETPLPKCAFCMSVLL